MSEEHQTVEPGTVRCVDCAFFYGYTSLGETREDREFDPDLLRTSLEQRGPDGSSIGMPRESHDWVTGIAREMKGAPGLPEHWTWGLIDYMGCFKGMWGPWYRSMMSPFDQIIKREIEKTRRCPYFFTYQPGFSARQHLELEINQKRLRATQEAETRRWQWTTALATAAVLISLVSLLHSCGVV